MINVFVVQHVHEMEDGVEDTKMIGVYSTHVKAEEAVNRLRLQPGFKETPDCFFISKYPLDKDYWIEGYVTVTTISD